MSEKMLCDFVIPSHPIQDGEGITIPFDEVKMYAEAYAEMTLENMTHTVTGRGILRHFGVQLYKITLMNFACGGENVFYKDKKPALVLRNRTDWIICPTHHKIWEQYKQKFPVKGN